jgi:hypothetical protein
MASAAASPPGRDSIPRLFPAQNRSSPFPFSNLACPRGSAPITAVPSPPTSSPVSHRFPLGGSGAVSSLSSSSPVSPLPNGRRKSKHRSVKAETARPPANNLGAQQPKFSALRQEHAPRSARHAAAHFGLPFLFPTNARQRSLRSFPLPVSMSIPSAETAPSAGTMIGCGSRLVFR